MGVKHNLNDFAFALNAAPSKFKRRVLRPLAKDTIPKEFARIATQRYMQPGPTTFGEHPPPRPPGLSGPLRKVSLRLSRAVAGERGPNGERESVTDVSLTEEGLKWTRKIEVPYARIHEKGGSFRVPATAKVRSAMWALYYRTDDERYKAFALATKTTDYFDVRIPARPYIEPTLTDLLPLIVRETEILLGRFFDDVL